MGKHVDPWLRRAADVAGPTPSYKDSPLTGIWARATDPPDAAEKIEQLREEHRERDAKKRRRRKRK
jgi:hypothetical protein